MAECRVKSEPTGPTSTIVVVESRVSIVASCSYGLG